MSRYYEMMITISDMAPDRKDAVEAAARAEWDFGDCYEGAGCMTLSGDGRLGGGESEDEFATRITRAIWQANGQFCAVEVSATYLESLPCETYQLDKSDYDRLLAVYANGGDYQQETAMREINDLSYRELQRIVESIQSFLYIDRDEDRREIWNPDKEYAILVR